MNSAVESGIPYGTALLAFADAVLGRDDSALAAARNTILTALGAPALVDAAAVIATFMQMDRIADGTGIPVDESYLHRTRKIRADLGLDTFASAQNTLKNQLS
ncbi:MAG: hypothetical protein AB7P18_13300 [Candidatus Binatia bacterium]